MSHTWCRAPLTGTVAGAGGSAGIHLKAGERPLPEYELVEGSARAASARVVGARGPARAFRRASRLDGDVMAE